MDGSGQQESDAGFRRRSSEINDLLSCSTLHMPPIRADIRAAVAREKKKEKKKKEKKRQKVWKKTKRRDSAPFPRHFPARMSASDSVSVNHILSQFHVCTLFVIVERLPNARSRALARRLARRRARPSSAAFPHTYLPTRTSPHLHLAGALLAIRDDVLSARGRFYVARER